MTIEEAIAYFGSGRKVTNALGIYPGCMTDWKKQGKISQLQQIRLDILTNGDLKADIDEFCEIEVKTTYTKKKIPGKFELKWDIKNRSDLSDR